MKAEEVEPGPGRDDDLSGMGTIDDKIDPPMTLRRDPRRSSLVSTSTSKLSQVESVRRLEEDVTTRLYH